MPLYPAAAATCCAARGESLQIALRAALAFVIGVAAATAALGVLAALAGRTMAAAASWPRSLIAFVPLAMGLHILGWFRVPIPALGRFAERRGLAGAFLTGLLLSLVLAPCGTPILASVLSYAAYQGSVPYGGTLLFLYGLGAGLPILLTGTVAGGLASRLDGTGWRPWVDRSTGVLLLTLGFYLAWSA